jgi:hypothetical protein
MMTSRTPAALALALAALGTFSVSCTAIFAPRDDVSRCSTVEDCDDPNDNRYVPTCVFDDASLDLDSSQVDKICVADFKPSVGCNPESYTDPAHPFRAAFDELSDSARYPACAVDTQLGMLGCPPQGGACNDGLVVNDVDLCDDEDEDTPKAVAIISETLGQDVRDQFCRSYFCDERFVCAPDNKCAVCDTTKDYADGGCGQVYIAGARSCVYEDGNACQGENVTDLTVTFGACI